MEISNAYKQQFIAVVQINGCLFIYSNAVYLLELSVLGLVSSWHIGRNEWVKNNNCNIQNLRYFICIYQTTLLEPKKFIV